MKVNFCCMLKWNQESCFKLNKYAQIYLLSIYNKLIMAHYSTGIALKLLAFFIHAFITAYQLFIMHL